ncbi:SMI1/KNR4 family protein [Roseimicrobium sp. ORNL1]|uniref:SMI1/KNR4 family protein n=1 Tax=Roseimicrobium sp. ORNL1 TaxID=2711231 RepID=UPI0013E141BD|nr:SMI1/KNR4 family protein [Roseimicrobium sp. ORNL1]QIF02033.1 SMI1/KNR4 family protein [Roseimicrobium sp. ORNL1]
MASHDLSPKDERNPENPEALAEEDVATLVRQGGHSEGLRTMRGCGVTALLWFVCIVGGYVFLRYLEGRKEEPGLLAGVIGWTAGIYVILIGPALGVLYAIELVGYLNWRKKKGAANIFWRLFIGFWLLVFAALFLGFGGASMFVSVREFVKFEGLANTAAAVGGVALGAMLFGAGVIFVRTCFTRKGFSTEEQDIAAAEAELRAWKNLDFETLESQLGCTLPAAYKAMLQPGSEWHRKEWAIHPKGLDNDEELYLIFGLHLPDQNAIRRHPTTSETMLCFGSAEGLEYWIRPGTEDPPVYECVTDTLPFEATEIAPHLSVFLGWPKD